MQVRIRPAVATDLDQVVAVNLESWRHVSAGHVPQERIDAFTPKECSARWRRRFGKLGTHPEQLLVAEQDGSVIGFSYFGPASDDDKAGQGCGQIFLIYLKPDCIGYGVGNELIKQTLSALVSAGYNQVALWVLVSNERARAFYSRHEFIPDGATDLDTSTGTARMRYGRALSAGGTANETT